MWLPNLSTNSRPLASNSRLTSANWPASCSTKTQTSRLSLMHLSPSHAVALNQFLHQRGHAFRRSRDLLALLGLQHHIVNLPDLGGRTLRAQIPFVSADVGRRPDRDLQIPARQITVQSLR